MAKKPPITPNSDKKTNLLLDLVDFVRQLSQEIALLLNRELLLKITPPFFLFVMLIVVVSFVYKIPLGVVVVSAIFFGLFGSAISSPILLYRLGINPEEYRMFRGVPVARLAYYQQGGRPIGSIKTTGKLPPSIYAEETQAFIRDAKRILEEKSYKEFLEFCDSFGENESKVRGWIKRYGDKV